MVIEIMALGFWPRTKTIVSRNSWATQMCWNTVIWLTRANEKDIPVFPLDDERLRIDKKKCWANEAYELINEDKSLHVRLTDTTQSNESRPMWTERERTKGRTLRRKCSSRLKTIMESMKNMLPK